MIYWSTNRSGTMITTILYLSLLLSADIEMNPGPSKYPYGVCNCLVANNHRAVQCDNCDTYVHIKCDEMTSKKYDCFNKYRWLSWECWTCRVPNITDSFFHNEIELSNSFSSLSDDYCVDEVIPSSGNVVRSGTSHTNRIQKLKIMTVNCRSVRSREKQDSLLDKDYSTATVFPPMYDVEREDRAEGRGGVIIGIHKKYTAGQKEQSLKTNC